MRRGLIVAALAALLVAGCGGASRPKGPPALVFVSTKDGDYAFFGAKADGSDSYRLTKEKGDPSTARGLFFQLQPAWSPDGEKIAFSSSRAGKPHIFVMNADGTGTTQLTNSAKADEQPSWSPDGKRIVFNREGALFEAPARGGPAHRVGKGTGSADGPAYSPDGKLIAYDYRRPGYENREIYVMRADGTGIRQLTHLEYVSSLPAWSPDGKTIAFMSNLRGGKYQIYTIRPDGTHLRQVTTSPSDVIQPSWTPDGKSIGYVREGAIWTDTDGTSKKLTSGKNNDSDPEWRPVPPK
jgi:Tol biopolymer transport system component